MREIERSKASSFLSVLRDLGNKMVNFLFQWKILLALDFPVNKRTLDLLEKLDEITLKYGGRFYLAKNTRMKKSFKKSDTRIKEYTNFRNKNDCRKNFVSYQSSRLEL